MRSETLRRDPSPWFVRIYTFSVFALLLRYLLLLLFYQEPYHTPAVILVLQSATAILGIILGLVWKNRTFWPLAAYLVLLVVRLLFQGPALFAESGIPDLLIHGLWAFGACHSLGAVLSARSLRRFLRVFAAAWTIGAVLHSLVALYAAWRGQVVWNLPHGAFWGFAGTVGEGTPGMNEINAVGAGYGVRLSVILYCTISGAELSLSAMVALCAAVCEKKPWARVLYLLSLLPLLFAMGLTDTRACYVSFAAGAGAVVGILLLRALRSHLRPLSSWTLSLASAAAVMVLLVLLISRTTAVYNSLKAHGGLLISSALAEEAPATVVSSRGFAGDLDTILSGRLEVWRYILRYLRDNPRVLLLGESVWLPMRGANAQPGLTHVVGHPHNALLLVLLQAGLPGLLLILWVLFSAFRRSVRLVSRPDTPLWQVLLPALILSICIGDSVECISGFLGYPYPNCSLLFLAIGLLYRPSSAEPGQ